ncbi:MAG: hypothetical protein FRX49_11482 [Trebouxia sp. A1-2]|nr:MAG: hypothetical protein FRX49_11482 [Trebouxia sp. A1-2]
MRLKRKLVLQQAVHHGVYMLSGGVRKAVLVPDDSDRVDGETCTTAAIGAVKLELACTPGPSTTAASNAAADGSDFKLPSLNVGVHYADEHNTKLLLEHVWVKGEVPEAENEPMAAISLFDRQIVTSLVRHIKYIKAATKERNEQALYKASVEQM